MLEIVEREEVIKNEDLMSTTELEVQRAALAREILISDETMINSVWLLLKGYNPLAVRQEMPKKRKLGILDGKAQIEFSDDFEMTTEELLSMQ